MYILQVARVALLLVEGGVVCTLALDNMARVEKRPEYQPSMHRMSRVHRKGTLMRFDPGGSFQMEKILKNYLSSNYIHR